MERRRELRVSSNQSVHITILDQQRRRIEGITINASGRGISVDIREEIRSGAPVKIELDDALLLGEICYCRSHDQGCLIGVKIDQVLDGLAALHHLNRTLLGPTGDNTLETQSRALSYSVSEQA